MPRPPIRTLLPALEICLPDFTGFPADAGKTESIAGHLRSIVLKHRDATNLTFYTSRDIARFFGVCQQTATLAVGVLEKEGLLRRIRGSHTVITGKSNITRIPLRAVAGFPMGFVQSRYSYPHKRLSRDLSDELWRHNMALDIISYVEIGGHLPDFNKRLHGHGINFAIWISPHTHDRSAMLHLEDQGVRNLIVDYNTRTAGFKPDIIIDIMRCYAAFGRRWKTNYGIRKVLVIEPSEYPTERIESFAKVMTQHGLECEVHKSTPTLAIELEETYRDADPIGIAILDERATAEFTFYAPAAFVALARRHRVLYGNNYTEVPFAGNGEILVDRISIDHPTLTNVICATLLRWLNKDYAHRPTKVATLPGYGIPLWRYL